MPSGTDISPQALRTLLAVEPLPRADLGALSAALRPSPARAPSLLARLRRRLGLGLDRGPRLLDAIGPALTAAEVRRAADTVPALEPVPRGPARWVRVPSSARRCRPAPLPVRTAEQATPPGSGEAPADRTPLPIRQGRLGDCWFIAALAACEHSRPGFVEGLVRDLPNGLVSVHLPGLAPRPVTLTRRVPVAHRAGDLRLRPTAASLVEKALAVTYGRGSYRRTQHWFAGTALRLLTDRWCPARPVPRRLAAVARWLADGRPVVASTLVRPGGPFLVPREDDPERAVAVMDRHVYVVHGVARTTEDGAPDPSAELRVHLRNPVGGRETEPRRTDLFLSAEQLRRACISVNVGPRLR